MSETKRLIKVQQDHINELNKWLTGERKPLSKYQRIDLKEVRENIEESKIKIKRLKSKKTVAIKYEEVRTFFDWLIEHKQSEKPIPPPQKVMNIAAKYKWIYNGFAYRGIKIKDFNIYHGRKIVLTELKGKGLLKKKKGDKIQYRSFRRESWTKSKKIAVSFAISNMPQSFASRKILVQHAKYERTRGIVIKGRIKNGLDIEKAIRFIENEATYQENLYHYLGQMPGFGTEGEILGQSVGLVTIVDKINC